jgi:hypothetical protein
MACGSCGGGSKPIFPAENARKNNHSIGGIVRNLSEAGSKAPNAFNWFRDGITGIVKCLTGTTLYTDEEIIKNRDVCRKCEHSTKNNKNELSSKSQCMAPDPSKNNAPCGCFIICKTQTDKCPLSKWTHLTVDKNLQKIKENLYHSDNNEVQI